MPVKMTLTRNVGDTVTQRVQEEDGNGEVYKIVYST
jgi:hypothetical protein